jgi:hypothetical protein
VYANERKPNRCFIHVLAVPLPRRSYLRRIMAGKASPTIETYAKLAVPLGADLSTRLYPNTGSRSSRLLA